ncbi:hypothetical protein QQ008_08390 [Fulvivirgaceae bacterium BMA10]|uniref:tRNA_anti-like n=1 Tax=Splendidivirga corallicola TaxID=3051826 RepID=A0ABT8KMW3_9BACT|nr:hypothetical protein [Fulvivirgaceae bacterium BMA10]
MNKRNIIVIVLVLILGVIFVAVYQYNKPHRNISAEKPSFELTADEIYSEFLENESDAQAKYNDKVVAFSGTIDEIVKNQSGGYNLLLAGTNGLISCEIDEGQENKIEQLTSGQSVNIKGLFIGFDDLLGELQFKKCSLFEE